MTLRDGAKTNSTVGRHVGAECRVEAAMACCAMAQPCARPGLHVAFSFEARMAAITDCGKAGADTDDLAAPRIGDVDAVGPYRTTVQAIGRDIDPFGAGWIAAGCRGGRCCVEWIAATVKDALIAVLLAPRREPRAVDRRDLVAILPVEAARGNIPVVAAERPFALPRAATVPETSVVSIKSRLTLAPASPVLVKFVPAPGAPGVRAALPVVIGRWPMPTVSLIIGSATMTLIAPKMPIPAVGTPADSGRTASPRTLVPAMIAVLSRMPDPVVSGDGFVDIAAHQTKEAGCQ